MIRISNNRGRLLGLPASLPVSREKKKKKKKKKLSRYMPWRHMGGEEV
jgi:hypothetical protein